MSIAETSFADAVKEFKEFLAKNNQPTEILWVFLEDTFARNTNYLENHFWLKLPLPEENEKLAEETYRIGQQKNLGICLMALALCEGKVCCAVIAPKDEETSEHLLMSPEHLKLGYVMDMPVAKVVKSAFRWKLFRLLPFKYKQRRFSGNLPSKKDLQFSLV